MDTQTGKFSFARSKFQAAPVFIMFTLHFFLTFIVCVVFADELLGYIYSILTQFASLLIIPSSQESSRF